MMESNKDEALRASEIALKKMENKDFSGAQKIILKAQKLFPELDVSHLLTICKVHCAAEAMMNGVVDWYSILQVESGADEAVIRKQYLKLAFSLHPDKNRFAGSEAAFKLVAEAHSVLCDRQKRSQYDIKRGGGSKNVAKPKQQPSGATFWTLCPRCQTRYQYYSYNLNTMVRCIHCQRNFCAYHLKGSYVPTSSNAFNGSRIPTNMFRNQQSDLSSQQGHPMRPSSVGGGTRMKPNGHQVPANTFPNKQRDTSSQHSHPVQPSSVSRSTYVKPNIPQVHANMFPNQQGNTRSEHDHPMRPSSADGYTHVKPIGPQIHASMFPNEQHGNRSQNSDPVELSSAGRGTDTKLRMNVAQSDEVMKEYNGEGSDGKANQPEMSRGGFLFSTPNQERSSDPTPDPACPNIIDRQKSVREDQSAVPDVMNAPVSAKPSSAGGKVDGEPRKNVASTMSSVAGSSYLLRSDERKQVAGGNIGPSLDGNKRRRMNDLPADVDMGCKQIFDENIISDVRQSDPRHVSSKVDIQQKGETTHRSDLDGTNAEAADNITEKRKNTCYSEFVSLPDPDFFNFEKHRDVNLFSAGQIWALYDNLDGMPRYYAQIKHLDSSNFKVHLAWLLYDAMDEEEEKWNCEELPVACGNFHLGKLKDILEDRSTFSHIVICAKGKRRNSFVIYPNKGEVWALYKGWSKQWSSYPNNHRFYEYDVVEVLSSMSMEDGATVKPLVRIKGFVSLFAPAKDRSSFKIPSSELLRFSHSVPSYRTKGNEKEGVPRGFLELDNACLPTDLDAAFSPISLDSYMSLGKMSSTFIDLTTDTISNKMDPREEQIGQNGSLSDAHACHPRSTDNHTDVSSEPGTPAQNDDDFDEFEDSSLPNCLSPNIHAYPDPEFHNFEEDRSIEKLERGQIWALYSDHDTFPKFYGWIRKVEREPFIVYLTWLEVCCELEEERQWVKQGIPVSCGKFIVQDYKTKFETNDTFSHLVDAKQTGTKWVSEVLPQVGEIWAIYMNWSRDWAPSNIHVCEFSIGEIVERTEASIKLISLTQVNGYRSVFKPAKQKGVMEIPTEERLRFSHRIPSFRLTGERGGELRGFYELDPASVPDVFLYR